MRPSVLTRRLSFSMPRRMPVSTDASPSSRALIRCSSTFAMVAPVKTSTEYKESRPYGKGGLEAALLVGVGLGLGKQGGHGASLVGRCLLATAFLWALALRATCRGAVSGRRFWLVVVTIIQAHGQADALARQVHFHHLQIGRAHV